MIDKDMTKRDLCEVTRMSTSTVSKLTKGETVSTAMLLKICEALHCDISDIVETIEK